jgi:hypothetical protein
MKHMVVHMARSIECYGCYRSFKTFAHMILHLESGACPSDLDTQDLNMTAAQCFQWQMYIDRNYREAMLEGRNLDEWYCEQPFPFECPECERSFAKLSGLFQHASGRTCEQTMSSGAIGKLVRWLDKQHR